MTPARRFAALFLLAAVLVLPAAAPAYADLACHIGGPVATSTNGRFEAVSSAWGCRSFPSRTIRIQRGTQTVSVVQHPHYADRYLVSDDGRYLVADHSRRSHGDDSGVSVYREGRLVGTYTAEDLFGAAHPVVRDRLHYEIALRGGELVVRQLGSADLTTHRLNRMPTPASPAPSR